MHLLIDPEGVAQLARSKREEIASVERCEGAATGALRLAAQSFGTDMVRSELERIAAEATQATSTQVTYTEWLVAAVEDNHAAFETYEHEVAADLARFASRLIHSDTTR